MKPEILRQPSIENIISLRKKYERRLKGLNATVKRLHSQHSQETSFYVGRAEELEKVIEDLTGLIK